MTKLPWVDNYIFWENFNELSFGLLKPFECFYIPLKYISFDSETKIMNFECRSERIFTYFSYDLPPNVKIYLKSCNVYKMGCMSISKNKYNLVILDLVYEIGYATKI